MASIRKVILFFLVFVILSFTKVFAERIGFDGFDYLSIDFPEGFTLADADTTGTSFLLQNKKFDVTTIIRIYTDGRYKEAEQACTQSLDKLGIDSIDIDKADWRNQKIPVVTFTGTINNANISGYGISAMLPQNKGIIVILVYTPQQKADLNNSLMISLLDSLCIDNGSFLEDGVITRYLYPKSKKTTEVTLTIDKKKIKSCIMENDIEASEYVIEREYDLLCRYSTDTAWKEAWKRFYRMIYKDSYSRLSRVSFDIYNVLSSDIKDETDLAQKILSWTQQMSFERNLKDTDFTSLPAILTGKGSDCDSRSLLIAVLLNSWNIDTIIMVSAEYSHAMPAIVSTHKGHCYRFNGKDYLMGETTALGQTWGKIASTQDNPDKWIFVDF